MFASNTSQVSQDAAYVEDVFSTYLYTGNGSSQTITNGIDLSGKGGLTWIKSRSNARNHVLFDTLRGATQRLLSNSNVAQSVDAQSLTAFNSNGFSVGSDSDTNASTYTYASWTFRKAPKFFDVVTYVGDGVVGKQIPHNLGSTPGMIIVKGVDIARNWFCYHRSLGATKVIQLNDTAAATTDSTYWNDTAPTSTAFTVGGATGVNLAGYTYVAYLFAHDAGGFGAAGTDNVISCGSYTGNGSATGPTVTLSYEPQWVMVKRTDLATNWIVFDTMRGMSQTSAMLLYPNLPDDEGIGTQGWLVPTATGFQPAITNGAVNANGGTYIYIAIRRGPMKTPTSGTSVYNAVTYTGNNTARTITGWNFPLDLVIGARRDVVNNKDIWIDRLRGSLQALYSVSTSSESTESQTVTSLALMDGAVIGTDNNFNQTSIGIVLWGMRRAPGFLDEVCYSGTSSSQNISHGLTVVPEMMIVKNRSTGENWGVYHAALGNTKRLRLNSTDASVTSSTEWNNTTPTSSVFTVGTDQEVNFSGNNFVAYLFATCPGVSKVGSYTGTGTTQQINCGFAAGARFVLIKRTDSTGDWYVWDSARGIVAGNDPYLLLNSTAAEVTSTDYVDTYSAGFEISSTAPAAINANGGTFIYLAIA